MIASRGIRENRALKIFRPIDAVPVIGAVTHGVRLLERSSEAMINREPDITSRELAIYFPAFLGFYLLQLESIDYIEKGVEEALKYFGH